MSRDPKRGAPAVPIQRGDTTKGTTRYRKAVDAAKKRGGSRNRPGNMEGVPRFDAVQEEAVKMRPAPGHDQGPPPAELSKETQDALHAAAQATAAAQRQDAPEEEEESSEQEELSLEDLQELFQVDRLTAMTIESLAYPSRNSDPLRKMRTAIEGRCRPIDIGQYLMNGFVVQEVPIIPKDDGHAGLTVSFKTITDAIEVFVDQALSEEASFVRTVRQDGKTVEVEMSKREYERRSSEWALAAYINSYQGARWPNPLKDNGDINEDAMKQRMAKVRQLPSQLFGVLTNNLSWFMDRVNKELSFAALGNG